MARTSVPSDTDILACPVATVALLVHPHPSRTVAPRHPAPALA